ALHLDHAADDVGAERAVAAANAQGLAVPAVRKASSFGYRYQTCACISAGDGDVTLRADFLLSEHLQVVLLDPAAAGQGRGLRSQPGRQGGVAHAAGGHAEAVAAAANAGGGAKATAAGLALAAQARPQAGAARRTRTVAAGRLQQEQGLDLAAALVEHRQDRLFRAPVLRMRARCRRDRRGQGKGQHWQAEQGHGLPMTRKPHGSSRAVQACIVWDLQLVNKRRSPRNSWLVDPGGNLLLQPLGGRRIGLRRVPEQYPNPVQGEVVLLAAE